MSPISVTLACFAYAVIRYQGYEGANLSRLPAFLINKGVSTAAILMLAWSSCLRWRGRLEEAGRHLRAFALCVVVHVPLSLILLKPAYFQEFFRSDGTLHFTAELMVLAGATCLAAAWKNRSGDKTPLVLILAFTHVTCMGLLRGLKFTAAHFYLPAMWLLSLIAAALGLAFALRRKSF